MNTGQAITQALRGQYAADRERLAQELDDKTTKVVVSGPRIPVSPELIADAEPVANLLRAARLDWYLWEPE